MSPYGITYFRSFVLVIKISAIRILARRRRVNLGLVRLLFGGFRYSNLSAAVVSAKVDLEFFLSACLKQLNSLLNNCLRKTDPEIQHNSSNLAHHSAIFRE